MCLLQHLVVDQGNVAGAQGGQHARIKQGFDLLLTPGDTVAGVGEQLAQAIGQVGDDGQETLGRALAVFGEVHEEAIGAAHAVLGRSCW